MNKKVLIRKGALLELQHAIDRITGRKLPPGWDFDGAVLETDYDWIALQAAFLLSKLPANEEANIAAMQEQIRTLSESLEDLKTAFWSWVEETMPGDRKPEDIYAVLKCYKGE